ncbi:hypothetical protein B4135_0712 [Caldibacillus debilis]|uniref:Uncharacterized protein n=1 Tax=Caldibacillus debilis TaxID=301148 RepID=A0A150M5L4_9BACI|nr:hypothetical protein B4135_0712 [Caldibacillus debilis]
MAAEILRPSLHLRIVPITRKTGETHSKAEQGAPRLIMNANPGGCFGTG